MRQLKISKQITNRESQSLDKYLQEIGKVDLLTPDEEVTLAQLNNTKTKGLAWVTSSMKVTLASSKLPSVLTKPEASNSFLTLFGGFARAFCRPWPSRAALCVCLSIG
jgi:hypothetical protein